MELDDIIDYLNEDTRFLRVKHNPLTIGVWSTSGQVPLKKDIARKGYGKYTIKIMDCTYDGVEAIIELSIGGDEPTCSFEGFVETLEDFKIILKCLGL